MKAIIVLLYWTKLGIFGHAKTTRILLYHYLTLLYVEKSGLRSVLKRYWLRHIKATFVEFFVLLQSLSAKIASMSIFELLLNWVAAAIIPDDNNAREIIRYFIDVQKRAKFLGVISSHAADTQTDIFPTCTLQRENGVIFFHVQKILLLFSI